MLTEPARAPKLYSYVVARDYGFAPNPFFGVCTLATCKPLIRRHARVGDWILGTGSKRFGLEERAVFVMRVGEALSYDAYWKDPRFRRKRPNLAGSLKQAFGDNIYHRDRATGRWIQENSHHSREDGRTNRNNVRHDTQTDRVLIGSEFIYWGSRGPKIPLRFRRGADVCAGRGHKNDFADGFIEEFVAWIGSLGSRGYIADPLEFGRKPRAGRARRKP